MSKVFRVFIFLFLGALFILCSFSCDENAKKEISYSKFRFRLDEGFLVSDTYHITNESGINLDNVTINVTATGHDGNKKAKKAFWSVWKSGDTKKIDAYIANDETVPNVQRIDVRGSNDTYRFAFSMTYDK